MRWQAGKALDGARADHAVLEPNGDLRWHVARVLAGVVLLGSMTTLPSSCWTSALLRAARHGEP
ncbi:MAG: hypothetical protein WBR33_08035 [Pseudonocardiaceae bacterium]